MNTSLVNLSDYPIDQPQSSQYQSLVKSLRENFVETGLVNIENFLTPEGIAKFISEIDERMLQAYFSQHGPSSYFDEFSNLLPNESLDSSSHCLGRSLLLNTAMDTLYHWPPMRQFTGDVTGHEKIYVHEDPSNALIVQVYKAGCGVGWHFDRALFSSIINLSEPISGGVFECVPGLRTEENPCFDEVRDVLLDRSERVQKHHIKAGSLSLMLSRYAFHRVTKVEQENSRISLILTYELEPGVRIDAADRKMIFGPSAESD